VGEDHAKRDDVTVLLQSICQRDERALHRQEAVNVADLLAVVMEKVFHDHFADANSVLVDLRPFMGFG
jgi:hypothetical protein